MKTVSIGLLFSMKAWHSSTYYHLPETEIMIMGTVPVKLTRISDGIMEVSDAYGKNDLMKKTVGVEVLEKDIIRMYFEAT